MRAPTAAGPSSCGRRVKVVDSRFFRNRCQPNAADLGGGAVYQAGNGFDPSVCSSSIHDNSASEGGGVLF